MSMSPDQVEAYPSCAQRLGWNFTRFEEDAMSPYWAAVIVASYCHDDALAGFGGFDFDDRSDANGFRLLGNLEDCIRAGKHRKPKVKVPVELTAMLGARGVKTSALLSIDDFWTAAETLFPGQITRKSAISKLPEQIKAIPKRDRKLMSDANLRLLPMQWLSPSHFHQRKLQ